jgi:hypothetical protein
MRIRKYVGYRVVKNAVLESLLADGQSAMTAVEIAAKGGLNPRSVRVTAKLLGIILKPDKRGGLRSPANGHAKKNLSQNP